MKIQYDGFIKKNHNKLIKKGVLIARIYNKNWGKWSRKEEGNARKPQKKANKVK